MKIKILREEWLHTRIINIYLKKVNKFSLSQKIGLVCRYTKSYQKYYAIFSSIYVPNQVMISLA